MIHFKSAVFAVVMTLLIFVASCGEQSSEESQDIQDTTSTANYPAEIVASGDTLTKVTASYTFDTAGSPLYMDGALYFTNNNFDQPEVSRTLRKTAEDKIDTLAMDNGVTTTLQASGKGTIYACQMLGHKVVELDTDGQVINVVAEEYDSIRIDGPNDLVVDQKGGLYFSDSQFIAGREKMQETPAVYYVTPDGEVIRVIDDVEFPNGMALSPDGSILYVANTAGTHLLVYDVQKDGTVRNKRKFAKLELVEGSQESGADGMAIDAQGNVYVATTKGVGVQVFSSNGMYLGNIATPTPSNNVSFGGESKRMLYISAEDGIYRLQMEVSGL